MVMPLQARVTLEIVHFDRRAVGGAPARVAPLSKEVVEPQPALDTGEESDIDSMFSNDASDRKDLTQECSELATRLANANPNRHIHMCPI